MIGAMSAVRKSFYLTNVVTVEALSVVSTGFRRTITVPD